MHFVSLLNLEAAVCLVLQNVFFLELIQNTVYCFGFLGFLYSSVVCCLISVDVPCAYVVLDRNRIWQRGMVRRGLQRYCGISWRWLVVFCCFCFCCFTLTVLDGCILWWIMLKMNQLEDQTGWGGTPQRGWLMLFRISKITPKWCITMVNKKYTHKRKKWTLHTLIAYNNIYM